MPPAFLVVFLISFIQADPGYQSTSGSNRTIFLGMMSDIKVYLDVKNEVEPGFTDHRPHNLHGSSYHEPPYQPKRYLSENALRKAVLIGLNNWASVLPDLNFRIEFYFKNL